jgi:signal transduction histidine kinase
MVVPDNQEFALVENSASASAEKSGLLLADRGLLDRHSLFILQKAAQASTEFLEIPLCIVGGIQKNRRLRQLAVNFAESNFEEIELFQEFANKLPKISLQEAFWQQILVNQVVVTIRDTLKQDQWAKSITVQQYGIRAYAGVPLLTSKGDCLGVLMAMDLAPRQFSAKEIQFLELTASWTMSELERMKLARSPAATETQLPSASAGSLADATEEDQGSQTLNDGKFELENSCLLLLEKLMGSMTQEMRNPLTSVTGMARVLNQEVYGQLNEKQKEYLNIIYDSGRYLVSLLDELVALRNLSDQTPDLEIAAVDIEMLCQQVFNHLELEATRRGQEFRLSIEPGDRLVLVDKSKVYQILYHLLARVISLSHPGGVVRIHVSRKTDILKIAIWVSHPWLGDGLNSIEMFEMESADLLLKEGSDDSRFLDQKKTIESLLSAKSESYAIELLTQLISGFTTLDASDSPAANADYPSLMKLSRQDLGLLLSWALTGQHQGKICLEGSANSGYRYLLELPLMDELRIKE